MPAPPFQGREVPEAWPLLLTREQLRAYLGLSIDTLSRICPVPAVELGAKLLRWRRSDIDAWVENLPLRLIKTRQVDDNATPPPAPAQIAGDERRFTAVERAKQRATARQTSNKSWKKKTPKPARSHSSNASSPPAA